MKCPIISARVVTETDPKFQLVADCLKDECAMYYSENQACSVLTIAQGMTYIHRNMLGLLNKMPRDLAPTGRGR